MVIRLDSKARPVCGQGLAVQLSPSLYRWVDPSGLSAAVPSGGCCELRSYWLTQILAKVFKQTTRLVSLLHNVSVLPKVFGEFGIAATNFFRVLSKMFFLLGSWLLL